MTRCVQVMGIRGVQPQARVRVALCVKVLTHSLAHSLAHLLTQSLTHSLTD